MTCVTPLQNSFSYKDLYVWYDGQGNPRSFELCYKLNGQEKSLLYKDGNYIHENIDDGEDSPLKNRTPVMFADGLIPKDMLVTLFEDKGISLEPDIYGFVLEKLRKLKHL